MSDSPSVLARLFGRSKHPVVSSLATAVLNRDLLAHPALAEVMIGAYLSGTITSADTQLAVSRVPLSPPSDGPEAVKNLGVINVAGGLVNRPMPGPSGAGPVSYSALRDEFDELLADDSVTAIVLRIESPGGMASGCFDLTDHIFASRGKKPIYALVDDYAYSGAYAIAAACDQIWISRTGGVGSVGACGFHHDWSGANAQMGLQVTAIYSGERKIDFNPNFPLTDEARTGAQTRMDRLYDMFTTSVATYRGVDVGKVVATQAECYQGQEALDVGLATHLGTWDDLVASLGASADADADQPGDNDGDAGDEAAATPAPLTVEATLSAEQVRLLARGAMLDAVAAAEVPAEIKSALLESVADGDEIAVRVAHAREVIDLCAAGGAAASAAGFVRKNTEIAQVRADLIEAKAKADEAVAVQTTLPANTAAKSSAAPGLDPTAIYTKRGN